LLMYLNKCKRGQTVRIAFIGNSDMRVQAIRLGISEGEVIRCEGILSAGPVLVSKNNQEIAIGRGLAGQIRVELVS